MAERQMQEIGMFVHGVLCAFHGLGILYNVKRKNWFDVAAHSAAMVYDAHAAHKHLVHARTFPKKVLDFPASVRVA